MSEIDTLNENLEEMIKELGKNRKWYQSIKIGDLRTISESDLRASLRTDSVLKFIPQVLEPEDKVLDVGCNAGLHSFTAAKYCRDVVGVDISEEFIEQAQFLKSLWEKEYNYVSKVTFRVGDILEELDMITDFDIIFTLKVLYHPGFVNGIHDFMSAIERSKIRAILAQGHVTHPQYSTICGMVELFDEYGFNTFILENIPEYPIVFAIRKGVELSDKITLVNGVSRNVEFYSDYKFEDNVRCRSCLASLNKKKLDFNEYKEIFERCYIEVELMKGTIGVIRQVPLSPDSNEKTEFAKQMGVNEHSNARVNSSTEFFDLYEKNGESEFLNKKLYEKTDFWRTISTSNETWLSRLRNFIFSDYEDKKRIVPLLRMYKNMKTIKDLVPNALNKKITYTIYHPEDFPWSINYFGYIKKRDGSHRRMIMRYFGASAVDEIVVDFDKITLNDLKETIPYIKDNFEWFYNKTLNASKDENI